MAKNLQELIQRSNSMRQYLISLPVDIQVELHNRSEYIHSAFELRTHAEYLGKIALISKL